MPDQPAPHMQLNPAYLEWVRNVENLPYGDAVPPPPKYIPVGSNPRALNASIYAVQKRETGNPLIMDRPTANFAPQEDPGRDGPARPFNPPMQYAPEDLRGAPRDMLGVDLQGHEATPENSLQALEAREQELLLQRGEIDRVLAEIKARKAKVQGYLRPAKKPDNSPRMVPIPLK